MNRKYLLKLASRGLVPDRVIDKRKLGFFRRASSAWLRRRSERRQPVPPGADAEDRRDSSTAGVDDLILDHRAGPRQEHVHLLISLLMLEVGWATYLPRAAGPSTDARERILVPG